MSTAFDIHAEFVSRDPEWAVTYEERDADGATRTCRFALFPGELFVGSLAEWDSPQAPIDSETRERILDHVFAWALSGAPVRVELIIGAAGIEAPLRIRGGFRVAIADGVNRRSFLYQEAGRSVEIPSRMLTPKNRSPRARIYPARASAWRPTGEPLSEEERARIVQRIQEDGRVAVEIDDPANPDPWSLARRLLDWDSSLTARVPDPGLISAVLRGQRLPPAETVFWSLELPALYTAGRTGWHSPAPGLLTLGPIAEEGVERVRSWLLGSELPLPPRREGGVDPNAETRMLTHSWAFARRQGVEPPAALTQFVVGVIVEHESADAPGSATLAAYADGRLRYVGSGSVVACEADLSPQATSLAGAVIGAVQATLAQGKVEGREHPPSPFRAVALTLAGSQQVPVRPGDGLERTVTALLAEIIEQTVPLTGAQGRG